jgi:hypothetical protein
VVEDSSVKLDNVGAYAFEKYSQESGAGWWIVGLVNIQAATKAVAAATEAQALSIDPHAVDSMLKKLTEMRDEINKVAGKSTRIATDTPLGSGYAEEVGRLNRSLGEQVLSQMVPKLTEAIDDLKAEIEKSRASYHNVDVTYETTMNKL